MPARGLIGADSAVMPGGPHVAMSLQRTRAIARLKSVAIASAQVFAVGLLVPPIVSSAEPDCRQAITTNDTAHCASLELDAAQATMRRYLAASLDANKDDAEAVAAIRQGQQAWEPYAKAHCDSVYTIWRGGTIRGVMSIGCHTGLVRERTHRVWLQYLTFMDRSEPVLPEPAR